MTETEIIELVHEAGFPRDTIFYRSDQFITFANAIAQRTREECAAMCEEYGWGVGDRCADKIRSMK